MRYKKPQSVYAKPWHRWFAWRPVNVNGTIVWLETIEREFWSGWGSDGWDYRFIQEDE